MGGLFFVQKINGPLDYYFASPSQFRTYGFVRAEGSPVQCITFIAELLACNSLAFLVACVLITENKLCLTDVCVCMCVCVCVCV